MENGNKKCRRMLRRNGIPKTISAITQLFL
jgi:hypothetical protein